MNFTAEPSSSQMILDEQIIHPPIAHPVHSFNEQPNVILDLIFSFLDFSDLEGAVFPVSRRLSAHLSRRSLAVTFYEEFPLSQRSDFKKFRFLTDHWNLSYLFLVCSFKYFSSSKAHQRLRNLNLAKECPRLEKAILGVPYKLLDLEIIQSIDSLISSFSGCRFLRSFAYVGPAVPSLGRLQQLQRLEVYDEQSSKARLTIIQELPQLHSIVLAGPYFSLECLEILQTFPALEEIELHAILDGATEFLVKIPKLKCLTILSNKKLDFLPVWCEFKLLEKLVFNAIIIHGDPIILPQIPSLKVVEFIDDWNFIQAWQDIGMFLSLNAQVESFILKRGRIIEEIDQPRNFLQMADFLENHPAITRFQVLEKDFDIFRKTDDFEGYSHLFTDRFSFRSSEHRREFITSLRRQAESIFQKASLNSSGDSPSQKRQKLK